MNITIDPNAGFCWGVVRTVEIAEQHLDNEGPLYVLGHVIHNPDEIKRLGDKGLTSVSVDDLDRLAGEGAQKVLVRAHGEPPSTYRKALELGIEIIDATCPVVTKLQERVRKFYDQGYQVVLFGKKDHAEVIGVRGVCRDECIVVHDVEEALQNVHFDKPTVLFSQTTMDRPTFLQIREALEGRVQELVVDSHENIATEFHAKDTICGQVSGREDKLAAFARSQDAMIFIAGRASSNGKVLYDVCRDANPDTHFIEHIIELQNDWLHGKKNVGISGATSTPHWLMNDLKAEIAHRVDIGLIRGE